MQITPDSIITLYKNVEIDNGEQLAFSSRANQTAYFEANTRLVARNVPCTIVKKTGALRLGIDDGNGLTAVKISECNYLSFKNPTFDNRIFYARIIDYDYVNNQCVEIQYAIDYWQTWMFDVNYEDMYIEREHMSKKDGQTAASNPYDPNILELRTSESLPVGSDLEKLDYTISSGSNADGLRCALGLHDGYHVTDQLGVLVKLADIDLKAIDDAYIAKEGWVPSAPGGYTVLPTYPFIQYLKSIIDTQDFGFYHLSTGMWSYITSRYPSSEWNPATYTITKYGPSWGNNLHAFSNTKYTPPLTYIYDSCGATNSNVNKMGTLFKILVSYVTEANMENNTLVDARIIPNDIMLLAAEVGSQGPFKTGIKPRQNVPSGYILQSPKLYRFPYCYVRIISPNGDVKELQYEKFFEMASGNDDTAYVCLTLDLADTPTLVVTPSKYKYTGMTTYSNTDTNILESLFFSQFPTLAYNIDGFLAQCAAAANDSLASRTVDAEFEMSKNHELYNTEAGHMANFLSRVTGLVGQVSSYDTEALAAMKMAKGIGDFGIQGDMYSLNKQQQQYKENLWSNAIDSLKDASSGEVASQLRLTKPAYAANHYYPSNGVGSSNFVYMAFCDIIVMNVSLNARIVELYDKYFTMYGYNSGRCGIPRICNYTKGITGDANLPEWQVLNGKEMTYVKTIDCKLTSAMLPVAAAIKEMFDSGVRFIKGD